MTLKDNIFQDFKSMGSLLGPLIANAFMSSIEAKLRADGNIPDFYKRFVDDTFTIVPGIAAAETFVFKLP